MGRFYRVCFDGVTVSQAEDLIEVDSSSSKPVLIHRIWLTVAQAALPASATFKTRARFLPATLTAGSTAESGASTTVSKLCPGDAAFGGSVATNNKTKATTSGTAVILYTGGGHLYQGEDHLFIHPPTILVSAGFVYEFLAGSTGVVYSGGCEFEELG